jgi:GTP cyclohydrolase II
MIHLVFIALLQAATTDPAVADPAAQTTPAAVQQTTTAQTEEQAEAAPAAPRVRCRRERVTGSSLSRRVCTTEDQDEAMREDARNMVNRAQSQMTVH